ncbi:AAEL009365-PA [Aedes aegypti]|uniref:AAEL009365-PA n=1 Tax=Aedes aegypti TaxID=7159 RepID=Q16W19_AEDAE|nr:AAEL009365-PA [Aedes aegypti]
MLDKPIATKQDVPSWTRKRSDPNRIGNTDVSLGKLGSIRRQVLEHKFRVQSSLLVSEEFPKQTFVRKNFMEQHHPKSESIRTCRCRWCNREDCFRAT